jgi:hypothetical protein
VRGEATELAGLDAAVILDRSVYQPSAWAISFHQATADELLGGGAAGPGKSLTLLWDPLVTQAVVEHARMTQVIPDGFPEWLKEACRKYPIRKGESEGHALHLRRSMPQLQENIDRSLRMFPRFDPGAEYSRERHSWTFSSGYKFTFGHCREKDSHQDYLSKQYTHLGFDEAYQFELFQYEELDARVRSADPVLMMLLRTRLTSNPAPGWLKERFVDPCPEGRRLLKMKVRDPRTGEVNYKTRLFLPATLDDNPDEEFKQQYRIRLLSKPAHMRARYLYGDWNTVEGAFFDDDWNPAVHVIKPFKIPRDWPKFRSMDWGYKAPGVIGWWAMDRDENLYCFYEFSFLKMKADDVAQRVVEIEKEFGFWDKKKNVSRLTGVADTQLWEERGDTGRSKAEDFSRKGVFWQPADKASIARNAERISERLRDYDEHSPPGLVFFSNCKKCIAALPAIGVDENDSTQFDKKSPLKHWVDMIAYATARASRGRGSIPMELHEFDRPDPAENDNDLPQASSFGYGS